MNNPSKYLRAAYMSALSTLEYNGIPIPVYDTIESGHAAIPLGGGEVSAYAVIKNQTRGDNDVKNRQNFRARVSVEIITKFSGASFYSGGNEIVEDISENMYSLLFNGLQFAIKDFYGFKITDTSFNEVNVPMMYNETSKIYRVMVIFTHQVEV